MSRGTGAGLRARLATEWRDAVELVLVPALAAVLPWRWCFGLYKLLARHSRLYESACQGALAQAQALGWVTDPVHFVYVRRLVTLVDHADLYLAKSRGLAWMKRHLRVEGEWPQPGEAALLCTFHWGAGMWGLRHAASCGLTPRALVAALNGAHFQGRSVLHAYARWRTAEVRCVLGAPPLDVSHSLRPVVEALRHQQMVLAAIDAPADQADAAEVITLANMRARVPRALLRLAARQSVPTWVYVTGLDVLSGERWLRLVPLGATPDSDDLIHQVFGELDALIRLDPAAWHFWGEAPRIFVADPAVSMCSE